jgi:uncharacterized protein YbgA (DUF1722 family)
MDSGQSASERLREAGRRIAEHPGYREYLDLDALGRSIAAVFAPNRDEVLSLIAAGSTDWRLAFELVQNVHEPKVREHFHALLTRHLHNYLASATSVREHTSRLMRGRTGPIAEEFERRKQEASQHPELSFGFGLRNYTSHRKLPLFAHTLSWTNANQPDQKIESEVELNVAELLEWEKWSAADRAYLKGLGDAVTLRPVIKRHAELVLGLNAWLLSELASANASNLAEVNELVVARNAILTAGDLEAARRMSEGEGI